MEEKELNLCELLAYQDLSGTYSPIYGEVRVTDIACDSLVITPEHSSDNNIELFPDGRFSKNGDCLLFPSRALYEKYPLDAKKAWEIWASERKPKRWPPQIGERIFWVNASLTVSQDRFDDFATQRKRRAVGNEFKTGKEAEKAAEALRECMKIFQEKGGVV